MIIFLIIVAQMHQNPKNFEKEDNQDLDDRFIGIMQGATLTYFGYTSFETSSTLTSEAINPLRDIPRSIIYTVVFCMIIYSITATSVVGVGIVEASKNHDADTALALAFSLAGVKWMA